MINIKDVRKIRALGGIMPIHFNVKLRESKYGFNICRDKYAIINNKCSFSSKIIHSDEWCQKHLENCLKNYDLNMAYFNTLDKIEFNFELDRFVKEKDLIEVHDLNEYKDIKGYYIMVLDEFNQAYIGTTDNIRGRIMAHWSKRKDFDRLIFGGVNKSILSIDSFRAFDTTRIFVKKTNRVYSLENKLIKGFQPKFLLNRTKGGILEGGLIEAIENRKTRELILNDK